MDGLGRPKATITCVTDCHGCAPPSRSATAFASHRRLALYAPNVSCTFGKRVAVLEVEQVAALDRPGHQVASTRELEVLVRLVEGDVDARPSQPSGLDLAHRGVHGIFVGTPRRATAWIHQVDLEPPTERPRDSRIRLDRSGVARLDPLEVRGRQAGSRGEIAQGPSAPAPLRADHLAKVAADSRGLRAWVDGVDVPTSSNTTGLIRDLLGPVPAPMGASARV